MREAQCARKKAAGRKGSLREGPAKHLRSGEHQVIVKQLQKNHSRQQGSGIKDQRTGKEVVCYRATITAGLGLRAKIAHQWPVDLLGNECDIGSRKASIGKCGLQVVCAALPPEVRAQATGHKLVQWAPGETTASPQHTIAFISEVMQLGGQATCFSKQHT